MTYGIDQCRRCGTPMRVRRDNPNADDMRLSNMSEAEWRAAGWLARPTKSQERVPTKGCCPDCADGIIRRNWKPGMRIGLMFGAIVVFVAVARWLLTIFFP